MPAAVETGVGANVEEYAADVMQPGGVDRDMTHKKATRRAW